MKDNIEEAYTWLAEHYRFGDRLFVFGFSRGAYTARALTGMLRTVGLLRPGAANLVPYALKLYAQHGRDQPTPEEETEFWRPRRQFNERFGNPDFPNPFNPHVHQVRFLGVWDTVKTIGWLNLKAQFEQARWPFDPPDPQRRPGPARDGARREAPALPRLPLRPRRGARVGGRYVEQWFTGVHSDVGGQYDDHRLSDIAFAWMIEEAVAAGLQVDDKVYKRLAGVRLGEPVPEDSALGTLHTNGGPWVLLGGWKPRVVEPGDLVHPSVRHRIEATAGTAAPYRPKLPG